MLYTYKTKGVCSRSITVELEGEIVKSVEMIGGCAGNSAGVAMLAKGRSVDELIGLLKGIHCGFKPTSCPDQLAHALEEAKKNNLQ